MTTLTTRITRYFLVVQPDGTFKENDDFNKFMLIASKIIRHESEVFTSKPTEDDIRKFELECVKDTEVVFKRA